MYVLKPSVFIQHCKVAQWGTRILMNNQTKLIQTKYQTIIKFIIKLN